MNEKNFSIDFKGKSLFFDMDGNYVDDSKIDYSKVFKHTVTKEKALYNKILMWGVLCGLKFKVMDFKDKQVIMPIYNGTRFLNNNEEDCWDSLPLISCINAIRFLANGYDGLINKDLEIDLTNMDLEDFATRIILYNKTEGSRTDLDDFSYCFEDMGECFDDDNPFDNPENYLTKYAQTHKTSSYEERYKILTDINSIAYNLVFEDVDRYTYEVDSNPIKKRLMNEAIDVISCCKTDLVNKNAIKYSKCIICDFISDDIHNGASGYIFGR